MARRSFTEVPYQYQDGKFGVAVGQTRNGVEELITLAGQMVWDSAASLWVPVSAAKPLPVGGSPDGSAAVALKTTATGEVITQLSGSISTEVFPTATRTSDTPPANLSVPFWARGAIVSLRVEGVTGSFAAEQGYCIEVATGTHSTPSASVNRRLVGFFTPRQTTPARVQHVIIYPHDFVLENLPVGVIDAIRVRLPLPEYMAFWIRINGTFGPGEGVVCDLRINWIR